VALAAAYMQKARESGDASYYGRAEAAVKQALSVQPDSVEALRTLAWVQTGKHEFREALTIAERLRERLPDDPLVHGLLGDAAVELGEYTRAEEEFQTMLDLRPGMASYSRAAYLRELYGDPDGAIEFMERAAKVGSAKDPEPLAWCLVQLGNLYFNQGRLGKAELAYNNALIVFPHYYQALAALGRIRLLADVFAPYIKALNAMPRVVLGSIFIITIGYGIWSKVALAVVLVFFVVFFNAFQGVREVDRNLLANARILGASPRQVTTEVIIPSALTWIIASLHTSFGFALVGAVVGEYLGAIKGLGLMIATAQGTFNPNGVFAAMFILAVVALTAEVALTWLEGRLIKWRPNGVNTDGLI